MDIYFGHLELMQYLFALDIYMLYILYMSKNYAR